MGEVSDGFHTFNELYEHRFALFIAVCKLLPLHRAWRSQMHADGTMYPGWFIMGIDRLPGEQLSYHLPIHKWSETDFATTLEKAPAWDGHTPQDVLERLGRL